MNKQTPLLWAAIFAAFSCQSFAQPPAVKESAGVQWVCGGVSEEGRRELTDAQFPANLSLTFATTETVPTWRTFGYRCLTPA